MRRDAHDLSPVEQQLVRIAAARCNERKALADRELQHAILPVLEAHGHTPGQPATFEDGPHGTLVLHLGPIATPPPVMTTALAKEADDAVHSIALRRAARRDSAGPAA